MNIFSAYYFGPIDYYLSLLQHKAFKIEAFENFQKQTYRNRCYVLAANGKLRLAIPILHDGNRIFKDVQPAYDYDWQKEHLKSLQSAYLSSPYFEYYEDELIALLEKKEKYLLDLNLNTLKFINSKLKLDLTFDLTNKYEKEVGLVDYRTLFNTKEESTINTTPYYQVFDEKFGFTKNLSILDLLFNEGPNAVTFLMNNIDKNI